MPVLSRTAVIKAPAERVFAHVDDIRNLAGHMSGQGSMPMMGSKLALEIVSQEPTGIGATYRYSGRVMGLAIDFSETVTRYVPYQEKVGRTIGTPRLIIIDSYEMGILVEPLAETRSRLRLTFDYELPRSGLRRLLGGLLAAAYARWCHGSIVKGTVQSQQGSAA